MSPFPNDSALSPPLNNLQQAATKTDLEQMFLLIEGILPFEACLYYQVLPLSIEGSSLNLGMVNPDDIKAADYVRRQVSYINCSIVSRPISSDWHREILSKFLSHSAKSRQSNQPTQPSEPNSSPSPFEEQPTLVVGAPTEIIENPREEISELTPQKLAVSTPAVPTPRIDNEDNSKDIAIQDGVTPAPSNPVEPQKSEDLTPAPLNIDLQDKKAGAEIAATPEPLSSTIADTSLEPNHLNPKELSQVLLRRIITQEGIGRLYLERQPNTCRILWSKDGVVQSIVEHISPQIFQGVINELKRMMSLSLIPVRKPKQIEIERIYNQKRILLRFRVMPGEHGEEATLQVLRGAALKFYQQQQIDNIGRDALGIAHDLQQRLDELRIQAQRNLDVQDTKQRTLPAIMTMLKQMEKQLHEIIEDPDD